MAHVFPTLSMHEKAKQIITEVAMENNFNITAGRLDSDKMN